MQRSRTIKTLAALLAALTIGTFVLLVLETRPPSADGILPLAARYSQNDPIAAAVRDTAVPVLHDRWLNVVIHDGLCDMTGNPPEDCHFVILGPDADGHDGELRATRRWTQQARGNHITVPGHDFDAVSIGICLTGDLVSNEPSKAQMASLIGLTRVLQRKLGIPAHRVYLHSDLTGGHCPGDHFPAAAFRSELLVNRH